MNDRPKQSKTRIAFAAVAVLAGIGLLVVLVRGQGVNEPGDGVPAAPVIPAEPTAVPLDTRQVAELYVAALQTGDKDAANKLIRGDALCSAPAMFDVLDDHLAMLAGAEIRDMTVTVRDLTGSVAYLPGSEGATIELELREAAGSPWQARRFGLATSPAAEGEDRVICWLWTGDD